MENIQDPPATPAPSAGRAKRRVHLTDELKLCLIKLCVENQVDFQLGKKMQFWATMSQLLQQEAGILLKDPAGNSGKID